MLASTETLLLPGAAELARLHAAEMPQKDELCGAYAVLLALRAAGVVLPGGEPLDQDAVGRSAGSVLGSGRHDESLPRGETGRRDYRLDFPTIEPARSGTSADGLVRAVDELTEGSYAAVAVTGPWTRATLEHLLAIVAAEEEAVLALNVGTRFFWGSHPEVAEVLDYLETGDDSAGPPPDWDVGHFVGCLGALRGPRGTLALIRDTYPSLGLGGVYLQPLERLAAALRREGMTDGGVLVVLPGDRRPALEQALEAGGLELGLWDNGSPDARAR